MVNSRQTKKSKLIYIHSSKSDSQFILYLICKTVSVHNIIMNQWTLRSLERVKILNLTLRQQMYSISGSPSY